MQNKEGWGKQLDRSGVTVLLIAIGVLSLAVAFLWLHVATPSDGARLEPGQEVWRAEGVVVTPLRGESGGLKSGDVVIAAAGRNMESWAQALFDPRAPRPNWQFGQRVTYTVLRDGERRDVTITLGKYPLGAILRKDWGTILFALVSQLIATYVFIRRPQDQAARVLFLWASGVLSSTTWSLGLEVCDLTNGVGFWLYIATAYAGYMLFWIAGLHFALIFPRKLPLILDHPWIVRHIYAAPYALTPIYFAAVLPGSSSWLEWLGRWSLGNTVLVLVYLALTIVSVAWGYRTNSDASSRRKMRWVALAALVSGGGGLLLWILPPLVTGHSLIGPNALGLLVLPFPLALAVAILRHHLFDIDFVINRALVYGTLTASTMGLYVFIVGYLGNMVQARDRSIIAFLATGLVAVLFQPLRQRLQRGVNRLMYGERDDPYGLLSRLGRRLETTLAPATGLRTIVETVAVALKLPHVAISLREGDTFKTAASFGLPGSDPLILPLIYQGEAIGQLICAPRVPGEEFAEAEQRLLRNVARQAGAVAHAVRLTADLQRSRERLVTAREEERRRLRRDLHDGLGPTLAALHVQANAARRILHSDPQTADTMLAEFQSEIREAIDDIRRVVYELRPPRLDEYGLVGATRAYAAQCSLEAAQKHDQDPGQSGERGLFVRVEAPPDLPPLPAAVEVAAYHVAREALTNVVHHARAQTCLVSFRVANTFILRIVDDGVGLPAQIKSGVGLLSMRQRVEELGGTFAIEPAAGAGTRVTAQFPMMEV